MIKLHGLSLSNYYNKVKFTLLEKEIPFEEVHARPSQEEDYLKVSSMGKIPYIEDNGQVIIESTVITEYIESAYPNTQRLMPEDPLEAARVREIITIIEYYIDGPIRPLIPGVFMGEMFSKEFIESIKEKVERGVKALARLTKFTPHIVGEAFTGADIAAFSTLPLTSEVMKITTHQDPLENIEGYSEYLQRISQRPHAQRVLEDLEAAREEFFQLAK